MNKTCRLILFAIVWDIFHFVFTFLLKYLEKVIGKNTIRLIVLIALSAAPDIYIYIYLYIADLSVIHCRNVVRVSLYTYNK